MMTKTNTHVYIARKKCGCVTGLCDDDLDDPKWVAEMVAGFIKTGRSVERVSREYYRDVISREPGFMQCQHIAKQLSLV